MLSKAINLIFVLVLIFCISSQVSSEELVYTQTFEIGISKVYQSYQEFKSDKIGKGFITIKKNNPSRLIERGHLLFNGKIIPLQRFLQGKEIEIKRDIQISSNNKVLIHISGDKDASITLTWYHGIPKPIAPEHEIDQVQPGVIIDKVQCFISYSFLPKTTIKENNGGEVSSHILKTSITYSYFSAGYEARYDNWSDIKRMRFGNQKDEPWKLLNEFFVGIQDSGQIKDDWSYFLNGNLLSSFENDVNSSVAVRFKAGLSYLVLANGQVKFGGEYYINNAKNGLYPYLSIDWNKSLKVRKGFLFSLGYPDLDIGYRFAPNVAARLGLSLNKFQIYKLANDSPAGSHPYLETFANSAGLYLDYKTSENVLVNLGVLYQFSGKYVIYEKDGKTKPDSIILNDTVEGIAQLSYIF